jgi:hypothetical protein
MRNIRYVKVKIENPCPIEDFLFGVTKEFIFLGDYFRDCETIEEIRDMFLEGLNPDERFDFIEVRTFTSKKNLYANKQHELICE